jgi:hypothetical protein
MPKGRIILRQEVLDGAFVRFEDVYVLNELWASECSVSAFSGKWKPGIAYWERDGVVGSDVMVSYIVKMERCERGGSDS